MVTLPDALDHPEPVAPEEDTDLGVAPKDGAER